MRKPAQMVEIRIHTLRGDHWQILSEQAAEEVFSVEQLKRHASLMGQGCFLTDIVYKEAILDDETDLASLPQPVEVTLVQHSSHWSPGLLAAAPSKTLPEVEAALRRFADPNSQDDRGWTALCFAASRGDHGMEPWQIMSKAGYNALDLKAGFACVHD